MQAAPHRKAVTVVQLPRWAAPVSAGEAEALQQLAVGVVVRQAAEPMVLLVLLLLLLEQLEQAEQGFPSRFLATVEELRKHMVLVEMVE
jgi:hypothetical protein